MRTSIVLATAVLLLAVSTTASAQVVAGTVRDSASQQPIRGAVIQVFDRSGGLVGQAISNDGGAYRIQASPAATRVRVVRLGFRPRELAFNPPSAASPLDVGLLSIPMLLEPVRITAAASRCPRRDDQPAALALLDQVRDGLLNSVVSRTTVPATMVRLHSRRRLGPRGVVAHQQVRREVASSAVKSFAAIRDAGTFVQDGFFDEATQTFFAPDAETLADPAFAEGYCFHIAAPNAQAPQLVGLGMRSAGSHRPRVDIEGILWVDSSAKSLEALEFRYTGLPRSLTAHRPGGRISFREMDNGVVIIDDWSMRLVSGEYATGGIAVSRSLRFPTPSTAQLYAEVIGGTVASAAWADGTSWRASLGGVRIKAVRSDGMPAIGVLVHLDSTNYRSVSDSMGMVEFTDLLPGPYTAYLTDPVLAPLNLSIPTALDFTVENDATTERDLGVITAQEFVADRCRMSEADLRGAWIVGRITDRAGLPVRGARWAIRTSTGTARVAGGRVGSDGVFQSCQLAPGTRIEIIADREERVASVLLELRQHLTAVAIVLP